MAIFVIIGNPADSAEALFPVKIRSFYVVDADHQPDGLRVAPPRPANGAGEQHPANAAVAQRGVDCQRNDLSAPAVEARNDVAYRCCLMPSVGLRQQEYGLEVSRIEPEKRFRISVTAEGKLLDPDDRRKVVGPEWMQPDLANRYAARRRRSPSIRPLTTLRPR